MSKIDGKKYDNFLDPTANLEECFKTWLAGNRREKSRRDAYENVGIN